MIAKQLTDRLRNAAAIMATVGWASEFDQNPGQKVTLMGAVRSTTLWSKGADELLATLVLEERNRKAGYNVMGSMDAAEALCYLRNTHIEENELEALFGSQWRLVVRTVRDAATDPERFALVGKNLMKLSRHRVTRVMSDFTAADLEPRVARAA